MFTQADIDKERAYKECKASGVPTMGVDHRNHYRKIEILMGKEKEDEIDDRTVR